MSNDEPADCWFCGDRACGIGMGFTTSRDKDPKWLCVECTFMIDDIRRMKRPDAYKLKARRGGVLAAAPLIEAYGTDLSEWSEEQADMLAGAMWDGCAAELRRLVRDASAPF